MSGHARLQLKTSILLALMVVLGPLGDVFLGKGMRQIGNAPGMKVSGAIGRKQDIAHRGDTAERGDGSNAERKPKLEIEYRGRHQGLSRTV